MKIEMHTHEKDDFWGRVDSAGSPCTYVCVCPNGPAEHVADCGDNGPGWMTTRAAIGCMAMRSDRTRCKSDALVDAPLCELHMDKAAKWFAFAHPAAFLRLLDGAEHNYARTLIRLNQADDLHAELAALKSRVYFLGIDDEIVKIGYSINPTNRAASIRQGSSICPDGYDRKRAKLLGSIPGGQSVEAQLHSVLRPHRIAGEWFHLHDDVRAVMSESTVNVPLLRKAVEWAEAEAAKPADLCEWNQGVYAEQRDCGTAYCIAGFVALTTGMQKSVFRDYIQAGMSGADAATRIHDTAARELGLSASGADELFGPSNTIEQVREIAESIAGERL